VLTCASLRALVVLLLLTAPAQAADLFHRPKVHVALGLGASFDKGPSNPKPDRPITAFLFTLGIGDHLLGLDLRSCANAPTGPAPMQLSRLSGELVGVVRPLVLFLDRPGYGYRVLRTASVDLGFGIERVSISLESDWRFGLVAGGHIDLPVGPEGTGKELRVRLGVRRLVATKGTVGSLTTGDTTLEAYGQVAFVF
jgi:hypothetical protein